MNDDGQERGLALVCSPAGMVRRLLADSLPLAHGAAVGQTLATLVTERSTGRVFQFLDALRGQCAVFDWPLDVETGRGLETVRFSGAAHGGDLVVMGTTAPLTAVPAGEHELYDQLSELNNDLANTQRELVKNNIQLHGLNDDKSRFLGMAAHDLRTPIGIILNYGDFLLDEVARGSVGEHARFIEIIRNSSQFMLHLIDDLLDLSAIETGRLTLDVACCEIVELLRRNLDLNRVLARKRGIAITLARGPAESRLWLDARRIEQVLNNLLSNAVKHSPDGSTVLVEVRETGDEIEITVGDRGPGIPEEEIQNLFQPFFRASTAAAAGTGLGLAIARKIVESHGGRIWVSSRPGDGAVFGFALPRTSRRPGIWK